MLARSKICMYDNDICFVGNSTDLGLHQKGFIRVMGRRPSVRCCTASSLSQFFFFFRLGDSALSILRWSRHISPAFHLYISWPRMEETIEHHDGMYTFRLFSKKATSKQAASTGQVYQTINLRSPTPPDTSPGFAVQHRPTTYYFTGIPTKETAEQYQQTAMTGEEVMEYRQAKWVNYIQGTCNSTWAATKISQPGSQVSWRVTTIDFTGTTKSSATPRIGDITATKKKRSGKKRRILIRAKYLAKELEALAARQALADKEIAWKENRARKNRKNKLKRKARDRLKKAWESSSA